MSNWKTTVEGILAFLITTGTFVSGYLVITPTTPHWQVITAGASTFIAALGRAYIGILQKDAKGN